MCPAGKAGEQPINYLLQDKLVHPLIHTGDIKGAKPPENMFLTQQHHSLVVFIHDRVCEPHEGGAAGGAAGTGAAGGAAGGAGMLESDLPSAVFIKLL